MFLQDLTFWRSASNVSTRGSCILRSGRLALVHPGGGDTPRSGCRPTPFGRDKALIPACCRSRSASGRDWLAEEEINGY